MSCIHQPAFGLDIGQWLLLPHTHTHTQAKSLVNMGALQGLRHVDTAFLQCVLK